MAKPLVRSYSNGEVTILWQADRCAHSGICIAGLPKVFDARRRPWVDPMAATTEQIVAQVRECPSGALSILRSDAAKAVEGTAGEGEALARIELVEDGPLILKSGCVLVNPDGTESRRDEPVALCRCGASGRKPFCDGSHRRIGFKG